MIYNTENNNLLLFPCCSQSYHRIGTTV